MKPKEANLCPIRNMEVLRDIHQVKAFLGCCQQMAGYVKEYAIIAAPLHKLTKKTTVFPKPWIQGSDYDKSFRNLNNILMVIRMNKLEPGSMTLAKGRLLNG
jgi:hypothetical protein